MYYKASEADRGSAVTTDSAGVDPFGFDAPLARCERGEISLAQLVRLAARCPEQVPLVNGEYAWIGLTMADLD
jgi:hypothetical protein